MNTIQTHSQRMARYKTKQPVTLDYRASPTIPHSTINLEEMYYDVLAAFNKHMSAVSALERAEFAAVVRALVTCYLEETADGKPVRVLDNAVHNSVVAKLTREELCRLVGVYVPEEGEGSVEAHNHILRQRQQAADAAYADCRAAHPGMTIDMTDLTTAEAVLKSLGFLESPIEELANAQG